MINIDDYKPFLIQKMGGGNFIYNTKEKWGMVVKSMPFNLLPDAKEPYKNDWKDENGDEEYVGELRFKAYTMNVSFAVIADGDEDANTQIRAFFDYIKSGEFKIYDTYTRIGRQHVRYAGYENKTFKRRTDKTVVVFEVKFKVNDPVTEVTFNKSITINPAGIQVDSLAGSFDITITSNVEYNAPTCSESWVTITKKSDNVYTVAYTENTSEISRRIANITVSAKYESLSANFELKQEAVAHLRIVPSSINVVGAGSFDFTVETNLGYGITYKPDWVTIVQKSSNQYTASYTGTSVARTGSINVSAFDHIHSAYCQITQSATVLQVSPTTKEVAYLAGSFDITITSNVEYNAPTCSESWVTITKKSDNVYTVAYTENTSEISGRTATINVSAKNESTTATCALTQLRKQTYLIIEPTSKTILSPAGYFDIVVSSNKSLNTPSCMESWATVAKVSDTLYRVTYQENTTGASRNNIVAFSTTDGVTATCQIIQKSQAVGIKHTNGNIYTKAEWESGGYAASDALGIAVADGSNKFLMSIGEVESKWSSTNVVVPGVVTKTTEEEASNDFAGKANTDAIIAAKTAGTIADCPAADWCRALGAEWYLPAGGQALLIMNNRDAIQSCLTLIGGHSLSGAIWSSTQSNEPNVAYIAVNTIEIWAAYKNENQSDVRAIRDL